MSGRNSFGIRGAPPALLTVLVLIIGGWLLRPSALWGLERALDLEGDLEGDLESAEEGLDPDLEAVADSSSSGCVVPRMTAASSSLSSVPPPSASHS